MKKGDQTREVILARAAELFNTRGFSGASLSDIMDATGLHKGGIYNHFASKEDLAVEAFDYAFQKVSDLMTAAIKGKHAPVERLRAIISFFENYFEEPPIRGGCILLNTAVESDDSNPALRARARHAMDSWRDLIRRTVTRGMAQGVMRANLEPDAVATLIIATLEGALMMDKLYGEGVHVERAIVHLLDYVETRLVV